MVAWTYFLVQGVVVINADAGRALRKACAALRIADVLDFSGNFRSGNSVYVTMRVRDGGQYAIATGVVRINAPGLLALKGKSVDAEAIRLPARNPWL